MLTNIEIDPEFDAAGVPERVILSAEHDVHGLVSVVVEATEVPLLLKANGDFTNPTKTALAAAAKAKLRLVLDKRAEAMQALPVQLAAKSKILLVLSAQDLED
jgi:hypothetical protein